MSPKTLDQLKPASYAPFYAAGLYPQLADIFRRHGYALAVHGSVQRDFDLIAVPWVEGAGEPEDIIREVHSAFAVQFALLPLTKRCHGRVTYTLSLSFGECALDLSFTPRVATLREMEAEDIGWTPCMDGDHEWRFEWPEWDTGFGGFKECKNCGTQAAIERGDEPSFDDDVL